MFIVFEVNTGEVIDAYIDERDAWSVALQLNYEYAETTGWAQALEYSVRPI